MASMAKTIYVRLDQDNHGETFLDASDTLDEVVEDGVHSTVVGVYRLVEKRRYRKAVQVVNA
jgi:hypothetical protein